jgi:hypothetical protein
MTITEAFAEDYIVAEFRYEEICHTFYVHGKVKVMHSSLCIQASCYEDI